MGPIRSRPSSRTTSSSPGMAWSETRLRGRASPRRSRTMSDWPPASGRASSSSASRSSACSRVVGSTYASMLGSSGLQAVQDLLRRDREVAHLDAGGGGHGVAEGGGHRDDRQFAKAERAERPVPGPWFDEDGDDLAWSLERGREQVLHEARVGELGSLEHQLLVERRAGAHHHGPLRLRLHVEAVQDPTDVVSDHDPADADAAGLQVDLDVGRAGAELPIREAPAHGMALDPLRARHAAELALPG